MGEEMPPVIVNDLDLHSEKRELLAATFGYSMFTYPLPSETLSTSTVFADDFSIAPNPVIDILRISTDQNINPIRLEVINLNGQPLLSSSDRESIDVSSLAAGNYILRIVTNKAIEIERFTKI